jgi:catechol 2,3-dioxygenase-like lactoylglutathione lyase family enzyme
VAPHEEGGLPPLGGPRRPDRGPGEGGPIAGGVDGTIVNLYYADLAGAVRFWHEGLGFPVAADQGWAVLLRLAEGSFLGLVDGARGHLRPQPASAVLVTLLVDDLPAWRARAQQAGATGLTPTEHRKDLGIERFFCRDPGGYELEFQRFVRPEDRRTFHGGARRS